MLSPAPRRHPTASATTRGFTLVELMITVVVVAVLAMVAWPSYMDSVRKGRRSDAHAAVNAVLQAQERYRGDHISYGASIADLSAANLGVSTASAQGYYTIATATDPATNRHAYTVTVTAAAGRSQTADTGCTVLTLVANAASTPSLSYSPASCWSR